MTVAVLESTARLDIDKTGIVAGPATGLGDDLHQVVFNLGRNFSPAGPTASGNAFTFTGHVGLTVGPHDMSTDLRFGFIQFMKQVEWRLLYAGRNDSDGQIEINPMPLMPAGYLLDAIRGASFSPFARDPARFSRVDLALKEATASLGDHTMQNMPDSVDNVWTGAPNLLYGVADVRKFISIFVVRESHGVFKPLAHVTTDLVYRAVFTWTGGQVSVAGNGSSFIPGPVVVGAPADPQVARLIAIADSLPQTYNEEAKNAFRTAALSGPAGGSRKDLRNYSLFSPPWWFSRR